MDSTAKMELQVSEEQDGSAVIQMPDAPEDSRNEAPAPEDERDIDPDNPDAGEDDNEREQIRAARREERKLKRQLHKEKAKESNHLITALRKQNDELAKRLAAVESKTATADLARIDKAIEDGNLRLQYAKMKIAEATKAGDGNAAAEAQEAWYSARQQVEQLHQLKQRAAETASAPRQQAPNPDVQRYASDWMERNSWYKPNTNDTDSKIALEIDKTLVADGFDPATEDYWDELDSRISKYLPHRVKSAQAAPETRRGPRSVVTGSGRESSPVARPGEYRLSPERVRAIKEAGKWDDPTERQKMIRRYAEYDKATR
jgi:hypothetical protein